MPLPRRAFLARFSALAACASFASGRAVAATDGSREFALLHGGNRIGSQTIAVARTASGLEVELGIDIAVRVFGLTVYRYRLDARERWEGGRLLALDARTNDNGTTRFARAAREGEEILVEGSGFTGRIAGNPATQSYWTPDFLGSGIWISLEDGVPHRVVAQRLGVETWATEAGSIEVERWRVEGEIDPIDLLYDKAGEWVGNEFRARGQSARFDLARRGPAITPLWRAA